VELLRPELPLIETIRSMAAEARATGSSALGVVVDADGRLVGTLTDGDVRRHLADGGALEDPVSGVMRPDPVAMPVGSSIDSILRGLPMELARRSHRSRYLLDKVVLVDEDHRPVEVVDLRQLLEQRVAIHRHVVVVGLGYVGLTLALVMADLGFRVTGVDADAGVVAGLLAGRSHVHEQGLPELLRHHVGEGFLPTTRMPDDGDVFIVAVGTPVRDGDPLAGSPGGADLGALTAAVDAVARVLRPGALVVLRSTVPVGTTSGFVASRLREVAGLRPGLDVHLVFAPERTAEGSALHELRSLPQLIGGITPESVEAAAAVFREVSPVIVRTTSAEVAELAKLTNNAFRDLTFAFANQVAQLGEELRVDVFESIRAANQGYPRGRVPLPSPGVGGPCLSKDPLILAGSVPVSAHGLSLMAVGRQVNRAMPGRVAARVVTELLARVGGEPSALLVVAAGLAFKGEPETADLRDSPGVDVVRELLELGVRVVCTDQVATPEAIGALGLDAGVLPEAATGASALLILNDHRQHRTLDLAELRARMASTAVLFDGWGLHRPEDVLNAGFDAYLSYGVARWREP
jgi:UDP-N-acetyl-D-mannosaminuronic acid dehydrogenase